MNPDYYKTNEKKLYKHELDRVKQMTDKELSTRYGKMGKQDKIQAFYEALTDEKRALDLRKKMEGNNGISISGKGITKAYSGSTRPKAVYALRSSTEHDDAGVWVKVFMHYNGNTVTIIEFENGEIDTTSNLTVGKARKCWNDFVDVQGMHRDDSYIEGLELGDVKI